MEEFRKLELEGPKMLRFWIEKKLDKYIRLRMAVQGQAQRSRSGPRDRFVSQLEKSEKTWLTAEA